MWLPTIKRLRLSKMELFSCKTKSINGGQLPPPVTTMVDQICFVWSRQNFWICDSL